MAMYNPNLQILGGKTPPSAASQAAQQRLQQANDAQNQAYNKYVSDQFTPNAWGMANDMQVQNDLNAYNKAGQDFASAQSGLSSAAGPDATSQARQQIQAQTTGFGDQIMSDPRITAALNTLDPTSARNDFYSQASDQNASGAAAQGDLLRQQMSQLGVSTNDPSYQAALRGIQTQQLQSNNANLATANQVGRQAATQEAQTRLSQMGAAAGQYDIGANYLANTQTGAGHVNAGYQSPGGYSMPPTGGSGIATPQVQTPSLYQPNFDFGGQQPATGGASDGAQEDYGSDYLSNEIDAQNGASASYPADSNAGAYMQDAANAGQAYGASQGWGASVPAYQAPSTWGQATTKMSAPRAGGPRAINPTALPGI